MTTRFESSPVHSGKAAELSARFSFASEMDSGVPSDSVVLPPKRKRGRPRKSIPLDVLEAARTTKREKKREATPSHATKTLASLASPSSSCKKIVAKNDFFDDEYFELDGYGGEPPFYEDELSTLDEFERLSSSIVHETASGKRRATSVIRKRLDEPSGTPKPAAVPRKKKAARRRYIDPSTCERDYTADEIEFMNALSEYKRNSGRMFPTCSEILEVLRELGYEKR